MLLGGRKVVCSAGERWSARRERAVLLGATAMWERAVLLGDRGEILGGRGLCCWVGERWAAR